MFGSAAGGSSSFSRHEFRNGEVEARSLDALMYHHIKKLMYTVNVGQADPRFGNMLLEQFGGANGELAAAMQYTIQGLNCPDLERKDLLMDIGTEEIGHIEMLATAVALNLRARPSA